MSPARVTASQGPLRDPRDKRLPRIAGPCSMVLFGVTGDLARKKLMPAIYDLANRGLLPHGFSLVGFARRDWSRPGLRQDRLRGGPGTGPHPVSAKRSGAPSPRGCASSPARSTTTPPSTCSRRPSPTSTSPRADRPARRRPGVRALPGPVGADPAIASAGFGVFQRQLVAQLVRAKPRYAISQNAGAPGTAMSGSIRC